MQEKKGGARGMNEAEILLNKQILMGISEKKKGDSPGKSNLE